jgi:Fur family ferric uptake transcriptional regulator
MADLEEQAEVMRRAGYRLTEPRKTVLRVLAAAHGFMDAAAILESGRLIHPHLGRVSVYRTLDLLTELGLARKVHAADDCHSYARADLLEGHYLVCERCGQITEFPCEGLDEMIKSVTQRYGFSVHGHLLQLEGLCPSCQR